MLSGPIGRSKMRGIGRLKLLSTAMIDLATAPRLSNVLLVNGFWRSGTTALQQTLISALAAKSVFEPMSPAAGHTWNKLDKATPDCGKHVYMPLSASQLSSRDRLTIGLSVRGVGAHGYAHFLRGSFAETWSKNLVVKFTRLGFILDYIADNYDLRIVHIRRHPAAVFASFKETKWNWRFEDMRFSDVYPVEEYGQGSPEREMANILRQHDNTPERRLAAFWSLSEKSAQGAIDSCKATLINYDDLVEDQEKVLGTLGISTADTAAKSIASPVTNAGREKLSASQRKHDWRSRLTQSEIAEIASVVEDLFPEAGKSYAA